MNLSSVGPKASLRDAGHRMGAGPNQTFDVKSFRGNLYKQTLSPSWSKTRLRAA